MQIEILQLIEGARQARGLAVVIDVFRAFSTACYVMANGARTIVPVGGLETAYRLKRHWPDAVLMGERGGLKQPGFDYGNSPTHARDARFDGRTVVMTTSAGTQGIVNASGADEIVTGSFVNAGAIVEFIRRRRPEHVSLIAMGWGGKEEAEEDTLCAEWIAAALQGREFPGGFESIVERLKGESGTNRFLDLDGEPDASNPRSDFGLCLALNRFPFVLRVEPYEDAEGARAAEVGEPLSGLRRIDV
ncbi:2-phosphosulfolactate phosphatase [Paenibacillus thermoaerophilus]|uniref:Probable 2-phosphosulfolactate phosphatase n=1 Tax=Paenibacillus thermoaerophilus TaxID=1215385 RepID=A0ABW2V3P4_9BACL|nr:2-phosphosulfolactate phosphatase [Paenibacillus thermoaerophilus]TMV18237.1 2-phosphosulfolactate phosphatase [Paenibacillus thermoaerophilus]